MKTPTSGRLLLVLCSIALLAVCCLFVVAGSAEAASVTGTPLLGMAITGFGIRDADLSKTKALPDGAATIATDGLFLNTDDRSTFTKNVELQITAPVLTTAELPDTETMTYDVYHDDASDFSGEVLLAGSVVVQTGAGGAGDAAATGRVRLPTTVKPYIRVKATNSGAGDASGKSVVMDLLGS